MGIFLNSRRLMMLKIKSGKVQKTREVIIKGDEESLNELADLLNVNLTWDEAEAEYDNIPSGFLSRLYDELAEGGQE